MVKFITFLPITLAMRTKRQAADTIIETAQDAINQFSPSFTSHGCHCSRMSSGTGYGGFPYDEADTICKQWNAARLCLEFPGGTRWSSTGGACEGSSTSYVYPGTGLCGNPVDTCQRKNCEIDEYFANEINSVGATPYTVQNATECPATPDNTNNDSCCGTSASTYKRYNSETSWCYNGEVVITENCEPGQQKNELTNTCEACPADTYSNGRGRCVACNEVADIVIQYDGSGSMKNNADGSSNSKWWHQKEFIKDLVTQFEIGADKVRVGAFQYNADLKHGWGFGKGDTLAELQSETQSLSQHDKTTCRTCSQVAKGYDYFETFGQYRSDAKKVVLTLADGINGSDQSGIGRGLNWIKANDVEAFFIRIGSSAIISGHTWEDLVNREDNFITTGSAGWNGLDAVITKMKNKICAANASLGE